MLIVLFVAIAPAVWFLRHFTKRDKNPEPASVVVKTFLLGVLVVLPVLPLEIFLTGFITGFAKGFGGLSPIAISLFHAFVIAAFCEEFMKRLVLVRYTMKHKDFDEPIDGVIYGVSVSLGFAAVENIIYVTSGGLGLGLIRAITAVPGHAAYGAIMGYYLGRAKFDPELSRSYLRKALWVPVLFHGLYDLPVFLNVTANPGQQSTALLFIMPICLFGILIFAWKTAKQLFSSLCREQLHLARQPNEEAVTTSVKA